MTYIIYMIYVIYMIYIINMTYITYMTYIDHNYISCVGYKNLNMKDYFRSVSKTNPTFFDFFSIYNA